MGDAVLHFELLPTAQQYFQAHQCSSCFLQAVSTRSNARCTSRGREMLQNLLQLARRAGGQISTRRQVSTSVG